MDRSERREAKPSEKIYISNLSEDTTEDDLRKQFDSYGKISSVMVKNKNGIVFAFIEYDSIDASEQAIKAMNTKELQGKELKVEFARGMRERDDRRGGYGGNDRYGGRDSGYRGDRGGDRGDRGDRGGDRPKGCFNCQKDGHFARECPEPRQQRDFGDRGGRGGRGGFRGGDRDRGDRYDRGDRGDRNDRRDRKERSRSRSNDKKRSYRKRSGSDSY